jgi:hypothetical protein
MDNETRTYKAAYYLLNAGNWSSWSEGDSRNITDLGAVKVLSTIEDSREGNSYGDGYYQGSTAPAGIVFQVTFTDGEMRFYQKDGTYDSYGEVDYSGGSFFEVKRVQQELYTYERIDKRFA